jgi:topoisomerase-4 subunit A
LVAVVSSEGKLLAFPVGEVPEMPRGKGNKLYDIPSKKAAARTELMTAVAVVPPRASLVLWAGEVQKTLEWRELQDYAGERAQRGAVLKRGWPRKITRMEAQLPPPKNGG